MSKVRLALKVIVIVLILGLIAGVFYWFEYRPTKIRKDCSWIEFKTGEWREAYDNEYQKCLRRNGLLD